MRREGEVVILIIAFLEGGMRLPMHPVVRDYLRHFRLAPIQCAVNMFRILGSVDALNEQMGLRLTHHDVNWCYNLQYLKGKTYYMKARDERVRLIQCLPESSKGLNKDFLIVLGVWHDDLPYSVKEGDIMGGRNRYSLSCWKATVHSSDHSNPFHLLIRR